MEKSKGNISVKKEKVNNDGLSKKERRALKVQEKSKQEKLEQQTDNIEIKKENSQMSSNTKTEKNLNKDNKNVETANATKQLTEKELRKLEWEAKLAQQTIGKNEEGLSKAQLRAKRREQQEAQRLAKASAKPQQQDSKEQNEQKKPVQITTKISPSKPLKKVEKKPQVLRRLQIVNHLYSEALHDNNVVNFKNVHPAFVKLGVQYSSKKILGSNARCRALLTAVKYLINDLQTPPKQEFCRYLESVLQNCVTYLVSCRPFAESMTNALRHFKVKLHEIAELEDNVKKETLLSCIDKYIKEEIDIAGQAISMMVNKKINNGDVILTYGCSSLIRKILLDSHKEGKQFEVIVVDGRPLLEGRQMLQRLAQDGIRCSYVQINAISYVMSSASKVLLGAHALLTNGYVMSRIGTAQVALVAQAYNKPVLVCCETYKFSERVQTDSFVYNELGDGDMLTSIDSLEEPSPLLSARNDVNLQMLNLLYDVTPPDLITAVVTELAILPCTSAPVVLRVKPTEFA